MTADRDDGVTVLGDRTVTVTGSPADRDRFGWEAREFTIRCHSGRVVEGRWRGVPFGPVVDAAAVAPEATHLLVTGRDGYEAVVPVLEAGDAFVGFDREMVRVTGAETDRQTDGTPRFLARGLDSMETVRLVDTIEAVAVPPGEDPLASATGE